MISVVLEGEKRVSSTFCDIVCFFPNMFEVEGLDVPLFHSGWDSVHWVNSFHDLGGDPLWEEVNECILILNFTKCGIIL